MSFIQLQKVKNKKTDEVLTYVTLAWSYRPEGSATPRQKRIYLGKLVSDDEVLVSKKYAAGTKTTVSLNVLKEKASSESEAITWIESQCSIIERVEKSEEGQVTAQTSTTKVFCEGQMHLIQSVAKAVGLCSVLEKSFGEDADLLLHLAAYQVCESTPLYMAEYWAYDLPSGLNRSLNSGSISRAMRSIGSNENKKETFFRNWIKERGNPDSLIFDSTSLSTYSSNLSLAEYGYNRDKEKLPQVNLTMVSSKIDGLPVYYRSLPGSIPDVSLIKNTTRMLVDYGIENYSCVLDRGFYSAGNIREMFNEGVHFSVGVPFSNKQSKELIAKHRQKLMSPKTSMLSTGTVYRFMLDEWSIKGLEDQHKVYAYVYLNPKKREDMIESIEKNILRLEQLGQLEIKDGRIESIEEARAWIENKTGLLKSCFGASEMDGKVMIKRLPRAVSLMTANNGYTIVVSDQKMDEEAVMTDYRSRDEIEKLFDIMKNGNGHKRMRSGDDDIVQGRLLLSFIAVIIRKALEQRMIESELSKNWSLAELLRELKKVRSIKTQKKTRVLMEITKKQRDIFEKMGVGLPQIS